MSSDPTTDSRSCLGIFMLWILPSLVVPLICGTAVAGMGPLGAWLSLPLSISFLVYIAKTLMDSPAPRAIVLYVLVQIVMIPLVVFAIFMGICQLNGGMRI